MLEGIKLIQLKTFSDERGFFSELYREEELSFVQDNLSFSKKGVIRGMHFQSTPGQAKLITVISGSIFDVFVDIRPDSETFGKWEGVELVSGQQLLIPVGFAHGFAALSDVHLLYKMSSFYHPETEKGFRYDDPAVGIKWPFEDPILSERDRNAPSFKEVVNEGLDSWSWRSVR
jgi:dTDP-4-dehydrorhamnose 3,5-epimerase